MALHNTTMARQYPQCLSTSELKLISGLVSHDDHDDTEREVRAWDMDTMACEHTLRQAAGEDVQCLAGAGGAVWRSVGRSVVVWGRD